LAATPQLVQSGAAGEAPAVGAAWPTQKNEAPRFDLPELGLIFACRDNNKTLTTLRDSARNGVL
jgi:hypothetical protein